MIDFFLMGGGGGWCDRIDIQRQRKVEQAAVSPSTHTFFTGKLEIMCEQDIFENTGKFIPAIYWYEKL